ncbi:hypothetical protein, partial [Bacteroides heparinolyticus]|uniref:hypothetical protein n=1 Tax=Prevotella heparinolytica TaxID=28113 RepID=UPI0035A0ABCE
GAQGVLEVTLLSGQLLVAYIKIFLFHAMLLFLLLPCPKAFFAFRRTGVHSVRAKITKTDEPCCFYIEKKRCPPQVPQAKMSADDSAFLSACVVTVCLSICL